MQNISFLREPFSPSVYLEYPLSTSSHANIQVTLFNKPRGYLLLYCKTLKVLGNSKV